MPSSNAAGRNLLFGMLAVQMEFVSGDHLFEAMQAWMLDKNRPLGEILVERSALEPETRKESAPGLREWAIPSFALGVDAQSSSASIACSGPLAYNGGSVVV